MSSVKRSGSSAICPQCRFWTLWTSARSVTADTAAVRSSGFRSAATSRSIRSSAACPEGASRREAAVGEAAVGVDGRQSLSPGLDTHPEHLVEDLGLLAQPATQLGPFAIIEVAAVQDRLLQERRSHPGPRRGPSLIRTVQNMLGCLCSGQRGQDHHRHSVGPDPQHSVGGAVGGVAVDVVVHLGGYAANDHPPQRGHQSPPVGPLLAEGHFGLGRRGADLIDQVAQADHVGPRRYRGQRQCQHRVLALREWARRGRRGPKRPPAGDHRRLE